MKQKMKLVLWGAAVACSAALGGCKKPSQLVEVKIEAVWTTEQYHSNWSMATTFPHVIATRKDTGERVMIMRDTWGKPGDTFKISEDWITLP
jgi:hypothetical protein